MARTSLDTSALDELRALEDDNPGFLVDIVRQFLDDDAPARLRAIAAALADGDLTQVGREAHGLKNSCSVVGAKEMGQLCRELERSEGQDPMVATHLTQQLGRAFEDASVELNRIIHEGA